MAFEYFLYDTNFNNTLVDRGDNTFAPLPPNTGEIFIDFLIPNTQPLYLYRESSSSIILNDQATIDAYLNATDPPTEEDPVDLGQFTGYTAQTQTDLDDKLNVTGGTITGALGIGGSATVGGSLVVGGSIVEGGTPLSSKYLGITPFNSYSAQTQIELDGKINIITGATGNLGTFNSSGNLDDTGIPLSAITGNSSQNAIQIRRTTNYDITTSSTDIVFDTTDVENNGDALEHNLANLERIDIKEDGLYYIYFDTQTTNTTTTTQVDVEIYKNDVTLISGGHSITNTYQDEMHKQTDSVITNLVSGDYITVKIVRNQTSATLIAPATLMMFSLKGIQGIKGQKGDTGSGSNIILQNNNINTPNTPHDTVNFDSGFTVTDNTGGKATISLSPVVLNPLIGKLQLVDSVGGQTMDDVAPNPLEWGQQDFIDTSTFTHTLNGSSITVLKAGLYELSFNVNAGIGVGNRSVPGVQFRLNGTAIAPTLTTDYARNASNNDTNNSLPPYLITLAVNDNLEVVAFRLGDQENNTTKVGASFVKITYLG